jgi:hypothetical protein
MDTKFQHLSFIQATVNRLATQSFLLKGWAVTLVVALLAFASTRSDSRATALAWLPPLGFWVLDGYFLSRERSYRALYDSVRDEDDAPTAFSMDTSAECRGRNSWPRSTFSLTLLLFYGLLMVAIAAAWGLLT